MIQIPYCQSFEINSKRVVESYSILSNSEVLHSVSIFPRSKFSQYKIRFFFTIQLKKKKTTSKPNLLLFENIFTRFINADDFYSLNVFRHFLNEYSWSTIFQSLHDVFSDSWQWMIKTFVHPSTVHNKSLSLCEKSKTTQQIHLKEKVFIFPQFSFSKKFEF